MEKHNDLNLEARLCQALQTKPEDSELPSPVLNARLKAKLYQLQDAKQAEGQAVRKIPLWYLPALLCILGNLVLCLAAMVLSAGVLRYAALAAAVYTSLGSVALTVAGVCCASWKEKFILVLYRRKRNAEGGKLS